jgi:5-methylcytosine-specific restriction endonuclease McrA
MQKYVKIYLDYFDYKVAEEVICEACGSPAVDIHHIHGRGEDRDIISNLMALCRKCHDRATTSKNYVTPDEIQLIHNYFLAGSRKIFLK